MSRVCLNPPLFSDPTQLSDLSILPGHPLGAGYRTTIPQSNNLCYQTYHSSLDEREKVIRPYRYPSTYAPPTNRVIGRQYILWFVLASVLPLSYTHYGMRAATFNLEVTTMTIETLINDVGSWVSTNPTHALYLVAGIAVLGAILGIRASLKRCETRSGGRHIIL